MAEVVERIKAIINGKANSPHCLMEMSKSEVKVLEKNMITLGGLSYERKSKKGPMISTYENIHFGRGVHLIERSSLINGERMKRSEINLCAVS